MTHTQWMCSRILAPSAPLICSGTIPPAPARCASPSSPSSSRVSTGPVWCAQLSVAARRSPAGSARSRAEGLRPGSGGWRSRTARSWCSGSTFAARAWSCRRPSRRTARRRSGRRRRPRSGRRRCSRPAIRTSGARRASIGPSASRRSSRTSWTSGTRTRRCSRPALRTSGARRASTGPNVSRRSSRTSWTSGARTSRTGGTRTRSRRASTGSQTGTTCTSRAIG
mmetsp:Transcript_147118/g.409853  ORF Transcript_147118/g.409853 Transcript_147118/m.409853 type:complete len:225 (-) Transcript_147118:207-881(-)